MDDTGSTFDTGERLGAAQHGSPGLGMVEREHRKTTFGPARRKMSQLFCYNVIKQRRKGGNWLTADLNFAEPMTRSEEAVAGTSKYLE